jgi:hypothetical protein
VQLKFFNGQSIIVCCLLSGVFSYGNPTFLSQIKSEDILADFRSTKRFNFTAEQNEKYLLSLMSAIPMAKSAIVVSASDPVNIASVPDSKEQKFKKSNIKRVKLVAVTFAREDFIPMLYFQVNENWTSCTPKTDDACQDTVEFAITGPTRFVKDLNDFGSFPKAINAVELNLTIENLSDTAAAVEKAPAHVTWDLALPGSGFEQYLRHFRTKMGRPNDRMDLRSLQTVIAGWASQASESTFQ